MKLADESSAVTAKENMDPHGCQVSATPPSYKKPRMEFVQISPHFPILRSLPAPGAPLHHPGVNEGDSLSGHPPFRIFARMVVSVPHSAAVVP